MWADNLEDQPYTFQNLLPYFKKSVRFQPPNNGIRAVNSTPKYDNSSFSATGGPLGVSFPNFANAYSSWAKLALNELGLEESLGFTSGSLLGYRYTTQSLDRDTQTRSSSESSFLQTALQTTSNLNVYKSTLAKKIIFNSDQHATGVLVNTAGVEYVLSATKGRDREYSFFPVLFRQCIESHKAKFRSPQLLIVSGIGPTGQLDPLNISVLANRPGVGQNMWVRFLNPIDFFRWEHSLTYPGSRPLWPFLQSRRHNPQSSPGSGFCGHTNVCIHSQSDRDSYQHCLRLSWLGKASPSPSCEPQEQHSCRPCLVPP